MSGDVPRLRVDGVSKSYGAVQALDGVSLEVGTNEIMGLVGDNGAGKSTLLKILNGYLRPDEGDIYLDGTRVVFDSPQDAREAGIAMTYQHPALVESATAWENFFMGREKTRSFGPLKTVDKAQMVETVEQRLAEYGVEELDPTARVGSLTGGQRQILAISRSIEADPRVLLLDEPLTELSREDRHAVIDFVRQLRQQTDTSIVLVSHDLEIVRDLVDHLLILHDGRKVLSGSPSDVSTDEIVSHMA